MGSGWSARQRARIGPSRYLSWAELACHDGTPYPADWRATRAAALALAFEAIRSELGVPVVVLSAYRTATWNVRIRGATASQHLEGRALDLTPVRGATVADLWAAVVKVGPGVGVRGFGRYDHWVHMDLRPGPVAAWDHRKGDQDGLE